MANCSTGGEGLYLQSSAGQRLFSGDNPVCDPAALSMAKLFPPGDHLLLWEDKENSVEQLEQGKRPRRLGRKERSRAGEGKVQAAAGSLCLPVLL